MRRGPLFTVVNSPGPELAHRNIRWNVHSISILAPHRLANIIEAHAEIGVDKIRAESPETPKNTIAGSVWNLDALLPTAISKPSRGLFKPINVGGGDETTPNRLPQPAPKSMNRSFRRQNP